MPNGRLRTTCSGTLTSVVAGVLGMDRGCSAVIEAIGP